MRRTSALKIGALAGLILLTTSGLTRPAAPVAASTDGRATRTVARRDQAADRRVAPILVPGVRTFGTGARRVQRNAGPSSNVAASHASAAQPPALLAVTRKISGSPMAGSVSAFALSPDGARAVFIADKDTAGRLELYSVPVDGSASPIKISSGLVFGSGDIGVSSFQISPDSAKVVFLADPNTGAGSDEIFSAPINGSAAPVRLNAGSAAPVTGFGITRDSGRAVFLGVDTSFGSGAVEVYRATIGSASSAVQLSDVGQGNPQGDVMAADFSPDSSRVVYAGDGTADNVFQWYSVPMAAAGPGSDVQLSAALSSVALIAFTPDSSKVVYTSDDNVLAKTEIFSKPIGGGTRIQLDPAMAGDGVTAIHIDPAGGRVVYLADQTTAGVNEVYSAQILLAGSGTRLNVPMSGTQYADAMNLGPDATTVIYEADQTTPGTYGLFRVPIDASAAPATLHGPAAPPGAGFFQGIGTPIIGRHAVYPVFGATVDLFAVPFDGSSPFVQVSDPFAAGDVLFDVFLPASATRLMAYGYGPSSGTITRTIVSAPIRSDLPVEPINVPAAAGAQGVLGYEIASTESYAVYLQDQDTLGKPELYSRELDSDGDTVINASDNCPFIANASQTRVVLPAPVVAVNATTFTWGSILDVRFVRGPLSSVATLVTNLSGTQPDAATFVDATVPPAGTGWWYLFAPDCPGRSYQDVLGAEPARDLANFP